MTKRFLWLLFVFFLGFLKNGSAQGETFPLPKTASQDVITFYKKLENKPIWFFQGSLTKCGYIARDLLAQASLEALNAEDYEDAIQETVHPADWVSAELLLTKRLLEFMEHLHKGRVDPARISRDIKFQSQKIDPANFLVASPQNSSLCDNLHKIGIKLSQYEDLKRILQDYRQVAKQTKHWPKLIGNKPLKKGQQNSEVGILRELLILHKDLEDSASNPDQSLELFDLKIEKALQQFQKRHTLGSTGIVDQKTREALNRPFSELIQKIIFNMERLRWLPNHLGEKYIIVNVAGYQVQAFENDQLKLTIPAIVGKPSRKTPLFYATLKSIVINPSWGVPYNILVHDKLPKIINDPTYVRRSHFTVTDSQGNIVDPDQADWESEGVHYRLRQSPGRHNALGQLKFNIENPYVIYLHGTPDEKLFSKVARPFSSGCIRLKDPVKLAAWILEGQNWSADLIQSFIDKGATKPVVPEIKVPVYFTYQTVWLGEDGLVYVSDDPYRMDPKMAKVMQVKSE